jgi:hypothetical protein
MATSAVIEGCKEAGLTPGEGIRAALDGPPQDELALFDEDAAAIDKQFSVPQAGWGGGRRKGSKNRAAKDVIDYVRRTGTDPILALSKVASMSPSEVTKFTGAPKPAAMRFWLDCVKELKSTLYPGQTLADLFKDALGDDAGQAVVGFLALGGMKPGMAGSAKPDIDGSMAADEKPEIGTWSPDDKNEENQGLGEGEDDEVARSEGRMNEVND